MALLFDEETTNHIRELQWHLTREYTLLSGRTFPPHLTLKSSFELPYQDVFRLTAYIEEFTSQIAPFTLMTDRIDHFGDRVLYLHFPPTPELLHAHQTCLHGVQELFSVSPKPTEGEQVIFHATLALGDTTREMIESIKNNLTFCDKKQLIHSHHVALLVKISPTSERRVFKTWRLGEVF
ncbi:MAG: 2'-5' RNA ligase family protein [bacterium]|nr:2'-5' RNA ligase family protein [bacterium]